MKESERAGNPGSNPGGRTKEIASAPLAIIYYTPYASFSNLFVNRMIGIELGRLLTYALLVTQRM